MNFNFSVNEYLLIWNLLFQPSVDDKSYALKKKLWNNYKKEYNDMFKDKETIMKDAKNFIPNDDIIYNIIFESELYNKLLKNTVKYRNELMKLWDDNKRKINKHLNNIIKKEIAPYSVYPIENKLNIIDVSSNFKKVSIGKKIEDNKILYELLFNILMKEINITLEDKLNIKQAILELAIYNELETLVENCSKYITGDQKLVTIKRRIYPYWLMYLGVDKDDLLHYMMRDKIGFEIDAYPYEKKLSKMNIEEFIEFCIRNERFIIKKEDII